MSQKTKVFVHKPELCNEAQCSRSFAASTLQDLRLILLVFEKNWRTFEEKFQMNCARPCGRHLKLAGNVGKMVMNGTHMEIFFSFSPLNNENSQLKSAWFGSYRQKTIVFPCSIHHHLALYITKTLKSDSRSRSRQFDTTKFAVKNVHYIPVYKFGRFFHKVQTYFDQQPR